MKTAPNQHNAETKNWLTTLLERAKALDVIFACGGEVEVAAPLSLRGPGAKTLEVVERIGLRPSNVAKKLRAWCAPASFGEGAQTRTDVRVRDGRQRYARNGALAVEGLDEALRKILCKVRESLCRHDAAPPIAELHSLNVYDRGGHFVAHKDTPREPSVFGTLVVCLPLGFGGGRLVVEQGSRATFDWETRSYFGLSSDTEDRRLRWAAFFDDVDHHIETVTSGCRATLTYELRRAPDSEAAVSSQPDEAEVAFTAALADALADPEFVSDGGRFRLPCLHLYAVLTPQSTLPGIESLREDLKGRDRLVAVALERAGLVPRVVPYVFETCAGDSWRLRRDASTREKQIFAQKRLKGSSFERKLPIEFHAAFNHADDVTWLVRPPGSAGTASQPSDDPSRRSSCSGKRNTARRITPETRRRTWRSTPLPRSSPMFRRNPRESASWLNSSTGVASALCMIPAARPVRPGRSLCSRWRRVARRERGRARAPRARRRRRW